MSKYEKYYNKKKDEITKLSNNQINDIDKTFEILFDEMYNSKNCAIFKNQNKILLGKYDILGYFNKKDNKWTWAHDNKYLEKYLSKLSKEISDNISIKKINISNLDLEEFLKICLYYSEKIWIVKKNINFDFNLEEYIILTEINQIV